VINNKEFKSMNEIKLTENQRAMIYAIQNNFCDTNNVDGRTALSLINRNLIKKTLSGFVMIQTIEL